MARPTKSGRVVVEGLATVVTAYVPSAFLERIDEGGDDRKQ